MQQGKIITIEGGDGTGKKTQAELLVERLRGQGFKVETLSFPQYEEPTGKVIKAYLDGKFGSLKEIPAKAVCALYAADRLAAQKRIQYWLADGRIVILNRYIESNIGHQAAKLNAENREEMMNWIYDFEVKDLGIRPSDLVVFLSLPIKVAEDAMKNEERKLDIHESDIGYKLEVHKAYALASKLYGWKNIDCMHPTESRRLSIDEVSEKIWDAVRENLG